MEEAELLALCYIVAQALSGTQYTGHP